MTTQLTAQDSRSVVAGVNLFSLADRVQLAFKQVKKLHHRNDDGAIMVPSVKFIRTVKGRLIVMLIDNQRLWHIPLDHLRESIVLERISIVTGLPVYLLPPEKIALVYGLKPHQAENAIAFMLDLLPDSGPRERLPKSVDLVYDVGSDFQFGMSTSGLMTIAPERMYGVMIGGMPNAGKSQSATLLAYQAARKGYDCYFIQPPSGNTFIPELWGRVPTTRKIDETGALLADLFTEIDRRAVLYRELGQKVNDGIPPANLAEYNARAETPLPGIFLAVDEYLSFGGRLDAPIADLIRLGRKYGLIVIIVAHNWQRRSITTDLSSLMPVRLAMRVADIEVATAILESRATARRVLAIKDIQFGRGFLSLNGEATEVQMYKLNDTDLKALVRGETRPVDPEALITTELAVATWAINELGGALNWTKLKARFVPAEMSETVLEKMLAQFDARGYATRKGTARFATDRLRERVAAQIGASDA